MLDSVIGTPSQSTTILASLGDDLHCDSDAMEENQASRVRGGVKTFPPVTPRGRELLGAELI